ncbi:MAG: energy-coupling factor transporter ATPase [Christensenellales bacterium]|jgi:energy-coupling factor transport system ATP-binding protein
MPITVKSLSYTYSEGTPYEKQALYDVSITVNEGDFLGIIGHTGSGKSTFIQHLNGLIKLKSGEIKVFDIDLNVKKPDYKLLRSKVGMVFQYPEYQLFDETVFKDISFGPKNIGMSEEEINTRVRESLELVGLDFDEVAWRSPFELSGGQKRRVAIAGVIAMCPEVLILDEPTAGLDPMGKREILELVIKLKSRCTPTIIMISHDIDEINEYCSRVAVFNEGRIVFDMQPRELFVREKELIEMGLDIPAVVKIKNYLTENGVKLDNVLTKRELIYALDTLRKR